MLFFILHVDVAANTVGAIKHHHTVTCVHATCHTRVLVCARVCACAHVYAYVRVSVISGSNIIFKIYAKPTKQALVICSNFTAIFVMWDYFFLSFYVQVTWRDGKRPICVMN